ncbi:MAG: hypothetical protein JW995_11895 [Melioribacteraceae bacterium]|nr:hypothetical protein [Melioribacteraceae bacterium]
MGKASIILVLGSISIFLVISNNLNNSIMRTNAYAVENFADARVRNISNSVAEILLLRLGDDNTYRVNTQQTMSIMDGNASYRVIDTTVSGSSVIKLDITASYFGETHNSVIIATATTHGPFYPATVKAAITTNTPVTTLGTLIVDGRDHTMAGGVIPNSGTLGVWTTSTLTVGGASKVGGTVAGSDEIPSNHPAAGVTAQSQVYPGGYPTEPDSVLGGKANGYPAGTLKSLAQAGINGGQYVTDPAHLTYPLSGVTYVELPSGGSWIAADVHGDGILVVHNSSLNAILKNSNIGPFKGMVIADDIDKIHTDMIGAVIVMSPFPPSGNCIGNGSGRVMFSKESIRNATEQADPTILSHFGFAKKRVIILSWME